MNFDWTPKQEALRKEVRQFIEENVPTNLGQELEEGGDRERASALRKKIAERGWLAISWPKEYGGQGGDRMDQYIVEEEFARVGMGVGGGGSGAGAILGAGTEEQKRYFIPKAISGDISFCLGFTEPQGGADLAGLQCRAVRDGDFYTINGQ
ncbi:MAG: acyl-CoA dehydrogenase family protein, partial [Chloroflexota bacterium]